MIFLLNKRYGSIVTSITIMSKNGVTYGPYGEKTFVNSESKTIILECGVLGIEGYRDPHGRDERDYQVSFAVVTSDPPSQHLGKLLRAIRFVSLYMCHYKTHFSLHYD